MCVCVLIINIQLIGCTLDNRNGKDCIGTCVCSFLYNYRENNEFVIIIMETDTLMYTLTTRDVQYRQETVHVYKIQ